jgi:hypothetical protein
MKVGYKVLESGNYGPRTILVWWFRAIWSSRRLPSSRFDEVTFIWITIVFMDFGTVFKAV